MTYRSVLEAPARQQWEKSSLYSQAENCGPTCVTFMAGFMKDRYYGIEVTRRSIASLGPYEVNDVVHYGAPAKTPTHAWQQRDMLIQRGVQCSVREIDTIAQLHALVDSSRRPVLVGILMSRVPKTVRGHPFTGWHAVVIRCGVTRNGVRGFLVMDPNFSPAGGLRPDPTGGKRFYSDAQMSWAYIQNSPRWSVVPTYAKVAVPLPDTSTGDPDMAIMARIVRTSPTHRQIKPAQRLYKGPGSNYALHYTSPRSGMNVETLGIVEDGPLLYGSRNWIAMRRYTSGAKGLFFGHASTLVPQ